jgi:biopolymer transport protein ExbD/biopolymer transport protein TolR
MRRFSQRNSLVTLSDINITPLLDLAFVLLIIFIITTPLLTQSIELNLPRGGQTDKRLNKNDIRTVEITSTGYYKYESRPMQLPQLIRQLAQEYRGNENLVVYIRADRECRYDYVAQLIDGCQKNGIKRYSLRTDPTPTK